MLQGQKQGLDQIRSAGGGLLFSATWRYGAERIQSGWPWVAVQPVIVANHTPDQRECESL